MTVYIRLLSYLRPHARRVAAALTCVVLFALTSGVSIGLVSPFMRVLFSGRAAPAPVPVAAPANVWDVAALVRQTLERFVYSAPAIVSLERLCVAVLVVMLLKDVFNYAQAYLLTTVEQRVIRDLRTHLYAHLHAMPLSYFDERRSGVEISRITNDVNAVRESITAGLSYGLKDALLFLVCFGWVVWVSWRVALVSVCVLLVTGLALRLVSRHVRRETAHAQEEMGGVTARLQETIAGMRVVKAFGREQHEIARFRSHADAYYHAAVRARRWSALGPPLAEFLGAIAILVVLWYGGRQVLTTHHLTADRFFVFLTAMLAVMMPVRSLSNAYTQVQSGIAAAERIFSLLDRKPPLVHATNGGRTPTFRRSLRLENVTFRYAGADSPDVLRDVSVCFESGRAYALVGPSGGGKSTLVDLLPRFYDPTAGRVLLDDVDLREMNVSALRGLMGIVTQETILFHDTVRNNIAYGAPGATEAEVRRAARLAHAEEFIERLPRGFDTVIGDRGSRLSGGERQRIALARAILRDPPLLILDEATSALDTESELHVQAAMRETLRGRTAVVIAHRLSTVQDCDEILVMDAGRIVARGRHEELLAVGGLYHRLYEGPFRT